jgi:hypothetical protein
VSNLPVVKVVCPHARLVSSDPADPKLVCGPMERDQARADRIMEGAPTGVVVAAREDPSTFFGFCCGEDDATVSPDTDRLHAHFSACPIFLADREWTAAERLFGEMQTKPTEVAGVGQQSLTNREMAWFGEDGR